MLASRFARSVASSLASEPLSTFSNHAIKLCTSFLPVYRSKEVPNHASTSGPWTSTLKCVPNSLHAWGCWWHCRSQTWPGYRLGRRDQNLSNCWHGKPHCGGSTRRKEGRGWFVIVVRVCNGRTRGCTSSSPVTGVAGWSSRRRRKVNSTLETAAINVCMFRKILCA